MSKDNLTEVCFDDINVDAYSMLDREYDLPNRTLAEFFASDCFFQSDPCFDETMPVTDSIANSNNCEVEFNDQSRYAYCDEVISTNVDEHALIPLRNDDHRDSVECQEVINTEIIESFMGQTEEFEVDYKPRFNLIPPLEFEKHVRTNSDAEDLPHRGANIISCKLCKNLFSDIDFKYHVCVTDENKQQNIIKELSVIPRPFRENQINLTNSTNNVFFIDLESSQSYQVHYFCKMCNIHIYNTNDLITHINIPHHRRALMSNINSHFDNINNEEILIKCEICCRLFYDLNQAHVHLFEDETNSHSTQNLNISHQNNNDEVLNKGDQNEIENSSEINLGKFVISQEAPILFIFSPKQEMILHCEFCEYLFTDKTKLLNHSKQHNLINGFECFSCKINVPTVEKINHHWKKKCVFAKKINNKILTSSTYFICDVCEVMFTSIVFLYKHRYENKHFFASMSATTSNGEICESIGELLDHKNKKHKGRITKGALVSRRYLCEMCGKLFTQSSHLMQHLRFHKGIKPFICEMEGCGKSFTLRSDLNDHIRKSHTRERPFACTECGKRFLTASVYYQHRLIHRNERRYGCEECGKRFFRSDALKNHISIHTGEKPFACLYCQKSFRQKYDRNKHMRSQHPGMEALENPQNDLKKGHEPNITNLRNVKLIQI